MENKKTENSVFFNDEIFLFSFSYYIVFFVVIYYVVFVIYNVSIYCDSVAI